MSPHSNARLSAEERLAMVMAVGGGDISARKAAERYGISEVTVRKWVNRFEVHGTAGLQDESSRPEHSPRKTSPEKASSVLELRTAGHTFAAIAAQLGMAPSTAQRIHAYSKNKKAGTVPQGEDHGV